LRLHDGSSEGVMLRWGLIPSWVEKEPTGSPKAVVRFDRMERSKIFGTPWLDGRRCILPVAGFYTWQLAPEGHRQPFFVRLMDRSIFGIAGLWDRWVSEDDDVIESCSIICVPANSLLSEITDADSGMPAILRRRDYQRWLQGSPAEAKTALQPYRAERMEAYPVSPRINSRAVDDPGLIRVTG
jgi:putative SOS response-associated peptidase YedK